MTPTRDSQAPGPRKPRSGLRRRVTGALFRRLDGVLKTVQAARADQFATLSPRSGATVFLGDSITEAGLWPEWFPDAHAVNRGIGGETTTQLARRLHTAVVDPRAVFVLAGTNDLNAGEPVTAIASRLAEIIDRIAGMAPGAAVYLQSVMPRKAAYAAEVIALNELLQQIATTRDRVRYVDLWPALATADDALNPRYTLDGLHLNGAGYEAWAGVLRPIVDAIKADIEPADEKRK